MLSGSKYPLRSLATSHAEGTLPSSAAEDIQGLVREFLDAHATVVKLHPKADDAPSLKELALLNAAKRRRADALHGLSGQHSTCVADVREKLGVLSVMVDWFSDEDPRTTKFALLILREAELFLADDRDDEGDRPRDVPEGTTARTGWFFSKFLKF
jgi:hypothetical protein